jgi:hypothetical protein
MSHKHVLEVQRRERLAKNLPGDIQVGDFVALHRLVQKRYVQQHGEGRQQQKLAPTICEKVHARCGLTSQL